MRLLLARLAALLRAAEPASPHEAVPLCAGGALSSEWLAPRLVRLPEAPSDTMRMPDA